MTKTIAKTLVAAASMLAVVSAPHARAEAAPKADAKSIIGLGLLGGEVFTLGLAIGKVDRAWAYGIVVPLGIAGGAVGGYFVGKEVQDKPEVPVALVAGGMALIIPTVVATLNATAYAPPRDSKPGTSDDLLPALSFLDLRGSKVRFGLPAVEVQPLYTQREQEQFAVKQGVQASLPIMRARF